MRTWMWVVILKVIPIWQNVSRFYCLLLWNEDVNVSHYSESYPDLAKRVTFLLSLVNGQCIFFNTSFLPVAHGRISLSIKPSERTGSVNPCVPFLSVARLPRACPPVYPRRRRHRHHSRRLSHVFRLIYLHLTLAHSKGQGKGHTHFDCEQYRYWSQSKHYYNFDHRKSYNGFRLVHLRSTLVHS